jgi:hypothetical protein
MTFSLKTFSVSIFPSSDDAKRRLLHKNGARQISSKVFLGVPAFS